MRYSLLAVVSLLGPLFASAQTSTPSTTTGPTTKVLAIGHLVHPPSAELRGLMPGEVRDTVQLYLSGKIDQWFARKDQNGVVFLMNVSSVSEAHELLEKLPLGQAKQMEFELILLGPLTPLRFLLNGNEPAVPTATPAKP